MLLAEIRRAVSMPMLIFLDADVRLGFFTVPATAPELIAWITTLSQLVHRCNRAEEVRGRPQ